MALVAALRSVSKSYLLGDYEVPALRGVDLEIHEGEFTVIMGPSGSGKSTLLNLIGCIDLPTAGEVVVCGQSTTAKEENELAEIRRTSIGFIFQAFNLIPVLSVYENVEYALLLKRIPETERDAMVKTILEEVGLGDYRHHRPNQLSGGQRQRVAIARALVSQPRIVLADEPTANLDSATGRSILELMQRMNQRHKTTFIFATHDPEVLAFAQREIHLHDGQIRSDSARREKVAKSHKSQRRKK